MRLNKKIAAVLALVLVCAMCVGPACAYAADHSAYEPVYGHLEVKGDGVYSLKCTDENHVTPDYDIQTNSNNIANFDIKFTEPGRYNYLVYSKNPAETEKYTVHFDVQADDCDNLYVIVTCERVSTGEKPLEISYLSDGPCPDCPPSQTPRPGGGGSSEKTGDESNLGLYVTGIAFALVAAAAFAFILRKRSSEEND